MRGGRNPFECGLQVRGQAAQRLQLRAVGDEFGRVRQLAVHEQVGDFFELAGARQFENVVAAVLPAVTPDSATDFFGLNVPVTGVLLSASLMMSSSNGITSLRRTARRAC